MPSIFTTSLRLEDQANGENASTWGDKTDNNLALVEQAIAGVESVNVAGSSDVTLTAVNAALDQSRNAYIQLTGVLTGNINVIVPTAEKKWTFHNATTGAFTITVKTAAGTGLQVPQGRKMALVCDGTNVTDDANTFDSLEVANTHTARGAINESIAGSVAAAASTNIWGAGNTIHVTGSGGPITSFGTAPRAGARRQVVIDATPQINHNAVTLILPTAANIICQAGDTFEVLAETTTTFRVCGYQRADGASLTFPSTIAAPRVFQSTDAGAAEAVGIDLDRASGSPAANDLLMALRWLMRDAGAGTDVAAKVLARLLDPTAGSEDAELGFWTVVAGTLAERMILTQGLRLGAATGGDQGVGSLNLVSLFENGVRLGFGAMTEQTLTDGASIAWNMGAGFNFTVTLGGNRALANPTNETVNKQGRLRIVQDGTGGRTLTLGTDYETDSAAGLTLSTGAGAQDIFYYDTLASGRVFIAPAGYAIG